jgi:hypothetical protein
MIENSEQPLIPRCFAPFKLRKKPASVRCLPSGNGFCLRYLPLADHTMPCGSWDAEQIIVLKSTSDKGMVFRGAQRNQLRTYSNVFGHWVHHQPPYHYRDSISLKNGRATWPICSNVTGQPARLMFTVSEPYQIGLSPSR